MVITLKMPQYVGGVFGLAKEKLSCHTRNCLISLRYCINGLYLAAFLTFQFVTIAVNASFDNV